jgi:hypothetical protein
MNYLEILTVFSVGSFLKEKSQRHKLYAVCVVFPSQLSNQFTEFNEIWYNHYANEANGNLILFISYSH